MSAHGLSNLPTVCQSCQAKDTVIAELLKLLRMDPLPRTMPLPKAWTDRTAGCPCRPENGGSGVCGCTLSGPQITCTA